MGSESTVFVVDDDRDLCEALRWLLESDNLQVETYTSAESFLEAYDPERPGVLVLDVRMKEMSGPELQRRLIDEGIDIPVIMLTGHGDVPMAVDAMKTGAVDFLQKPVHDQILLDRIYSAMRIGEERRAKRLTTEEIAARIEQLTPREHEVMGLVVEGHANKCIANQLSVSEKTIEVHRKRVMKKMGVHSAVELVRLVMTVEESQGG